METFSDRAEFLGPEELQKQESQSKEQNQSVVQLLIDATFLIVTSIMGITTLIIGIPLIIMAINTHLERDYLNTKLNNYITDTRFRQLLSLC